MTGAGAVQSVETTGLAWGVKQSFVRYVRRVAHGDASPEGGAGELPDGRFHFPIRSLGALDATNADADVTFAGGVRFRGHAGMIDLRITDLELHLADGSGVMRTVVGGAARSVVEVRVTHAWTDGAVTAFVLAAHLAAGAEALFDDVYVARTPFYDLEVRVSPSA